MLDLIQKIRRNDCSLLACVSGAAVQRGTLWWEEEHEEEEQEDEEEEEEELAVKVFIKYCGKNIAVWGGEKPSEYLSLPPQQWRVFSKG